jgi:hypothetical protein
MGKKQLDATAHEGLLVVTDVLAATISKAGLTGGEFLPARRPSQEEPDPNYHWMKIAYEWPPMEPDSVLEVENLCPTCRRAGHFHSYQRVTEFHYDSVPDDARDFGHTWEYLDVWENTRVGGRRQVIVSQAARQ